MRETIGKIVIFDNYPEWHDIAYKLGWVHIVDDFVVCDVDEYCVGEFGEETGWLLKEYCG